MALEERSGLMKPVDKNGKESIFYPVNRAEDVAGLEKEIKKHLDAGNVSYNDRTVKDALEDLEAIGMKTFGVQWDYSNPSTELTRLTRATDPNHFVTVDITEEPVPAVGTGAGSSPFDNYLPWAGMEEYNIENGVVTYARGDSNFSRTTKDTMVYIPKYYYHIEKDAANKKMRFYISDQPRTGFERHPGSDRYVGRYKTSAGYVSKSGATPLVNITRPAARTGSAGKGAKWAQFDYATWNAIWLLYLVEFADWNSQKKIGKGNTGWSYKDGIRNVGDTDSMVYHTGYGVGTNGKVGAQYRRIEELWGNVWEWLDGVNFHDGHCYICTDPTKFADGTATNYEDTGITLPTDVWGYISDLEVSETHPFCFLPSAFNGSTSTYIPDRADVYAGWLVVGVGGLWYYSDYAGLFSFFAVDASYSDEYTGARLLFIP